MEKDWGITELTEMFRDEMESMGLLEPEHPDDLFVVDDEETEPAPFKTINYLLDSKTSFTREQLIEELGIKFTNNQLPTFKLFILNLYEYDRPIAFSYGNNPHPPKAWNPHQVTYSTIQGVVNRLVDAKLVKFKKGKASAEKKNRVASILTATDDFMEWIVNNVSDVFINCDTHVRLRLAQQKNKILSYEPTTYTKAVDKIMKNYHKKLLEWGLKLDGVAQKNTHLFVNFQGVKDQLDSKGNYLFRHGGRWHGDWCLMKSSERLERISFKKGGKLMEIDYMASGCNALSLWETGQWLKTDPYGWTRKRVWESFMDERRGTQRKYTKQIVTMAINLTHAELESRVTAHYKRKKHKDAGLYGYMAGDVMTGFRFYNQEIAHWYGHSRLAGRQAMFIESNLVLGVIDRLCKADIPVVTVYDSFIFPKKFEKKAMEIIYDKKGLDWLKKILQKDEQGTLKQPLSEVPSGFI